jgi:hypothetical protein
MKHVHPTSLDIVPKEMIVSLNEKFGAIIDKMATGIFDHSYNKRRKKINYNKIRKKKSK